MKQNITVSKWFPNMSSKVELSAVYQKNNTLIAVAKILPSGEFGEATYTSRDSKTVDTNSNVELPVKTIFVNRGQTLANIPEISGLTALPMVSNLNSDYRFSDTQNDDSDNDDNVQEEGRFRQFLNY